MKSQSNKTEWSRRSVLGLTISALALGALLLGGRAFAGAPEGHRAFTVDRMVSHLTERLSLTDAQSQQVRQILAGQQEQMTSAFSAVRTARQALRQASEAETMDEGAIRAAAQTLGQAEGDLASLHARIRAQIVPILNADQKQKLSSLHPGHWGPHPH